jgi:hypothetical protein
VRVLTAILGAALILIVLWDAFETVILPRRVTRRIRLARLFYRSTWVLWSAFAGLLRSRKRRDAYLGFYGPLSLLFLMSVWAAGLITGFGFLYAATGSTVTVSGIKTGIGANLYFSGSTFFTLGLGDITPHTTVARVLAVAESGTGFGFLAIVIGYLPVLYQAFSKREVTISLLDARAGSPPTAGELLRRHAHDHGMEALRQLLHEWERWSAELLESHLSYPVVSYFRSQHDNQSWLAALCTILDTCALVMAGVEGACERQAELTFAMARHATVDLAQIFVRSPRPPKQDRLPPADLARIRAELSAAGLHLRQGPTVDKRLSELRRMYEPHIFSLAEYMRLSVPTWIPAGKAIDNWQTSAWGRSSGLEPAELAGRREEHF